jgi:DNA-binding CsgD family transcriptional regulator
VGVFAEDEAGSPACMRGAFDDLDSTRAPTRHTAGGPTRHPALCCPRPSGRHGFTSHDKEIAGRIQPALMSLHAYLCRPGASPARVGITARETSVLTLLADGRTAHAIARRLGISPHTVNRHLEHVYQKLNTNDRLGAILRAEAVGLPPAALSKRSAHGMFRTSESHSAKDGYCGNPRNEEQACGLGVELISWTTVVMRVVPQRSCGARCPHGVGAAWFTGRG